MLVAASHDVGDVGGDRRRWLEVDAPGGDSRVACCDDDGDLVIVSERSDDALGQGPARRGDHRDRLGPLRSTRAAACARVANSTSRSGAIEQAVVTSSGRNLSTSAAEIRRTPTATVGATRARRAPTTWSQSSMPVAEGVGDPRGGHRVTIQFMSKTAREAATTNCAARQTMRPGVTHSGEWKPRRWHPEAYQHLDLFDAGPATLSHLTSSPSTLRAILVEAWSGAAAMNLSNRGIHE